MNYNKKKKKQNISTNRKILNLCEVTKVKQSTVKKNTQCTYSANGVSSNRNEKKKRKKYHQKRSGQKFENKEENNKKIIKAKKERKI